MEVVAVDVVCALRKHITDVPSKGMWLREGGKRHNFSENTRFFQH
jgi:hypothetical protein